MGHQPSILVGIWFLATLSIQGGQTGLSFDLFERSIRPVLVEHCYECHSAEGKRLKGGLRLDTREGLRMGGDHGPVINLRDPESSRLLHALRYQNDLEMPPKGRLPDQVIEAFETWITRGALDPRTSTPTPPSDTSRERRPLWSLQPLRQPGIPTVEKADWPREPLDHFILSGLQARHLSPSPDTDPHTFLRRLTFDLVGLPPRPDEIEAFVDLATRDPDRAIEEKVDQLLASPFFGERWGRNWMDVARYADSNGQSRDVLFPHAWRYRDWVIRALNRDLPFDQFIHHQLAGDLIPARSREDRQQKQIATGFLAIGSKPLVGGNLQLDLIDDQIDAVTRSFLGLTVSCARCHDHKFDPITTADYYSLGGIFASTKTYYGGGPRRPKTVQEAAKLWLTLGDDRARSLATLKGIEAETNRLKKKEKKLRNRLKKVNRGDRTQSDGRQALQHELAETSRRLDQLSERSKSLSLVFAMGVEEAKQPSNLAIRIRGDKSKTGDTVPRGFLKGLPHPVTHKIREGTSGRRELALWMTDPANPLTARVAVNRIWAHLFGVGLVRTVDNFGTSGESPSHPNLLDHLARRLVERNWSVKSFIKALVCSRTYRQASTYQGEAHQTDPENRLLWRFHRRRLEVEPIRDALLSIGRRLNPQPPVASVVAAIGEGEVGRGINTKPLETPFHHRAVYLPVLRTALIGLHKTFDFPDPSSIQGRRDTTNVPAQSLFLLNSPLVIETTQALATRLGELPISPSERVRRAFLTCYGRPPSGDEGAHALQFIARHHGKGDPWQAFCQALVASAEFRYLN